MSDPRADAEYANWHQSSVSDPPKYGHEPHRGNHLGYSCGLSGPHCWECNEPWPCRTEQARVRLTATDSTEPGL